MKQSAMLKFTILVLGVVAFFLGGCVEVNNPVLKPTDLRSSVRFVNFANMPSSTMSVSIDKSTAVTATATYLNASTYKDLPAGSRFWSFTYGSTTDTLRQALTANYQYTYYSVYEPGDASRTYLLAAERNTYAGTFTYAPGTQVVRFLNLSSDTAATVSGGLTFHLMYGTKDTSATIGYGASTDYFQAPLASSPKYMVVGAAGDTLVGATAVNAAAGRYSVIFVGLQASSSWQTKVFTEN